MLQGVLENVGLPVMALLLLAGLVFPPFWPWAAGICGVAFAIDIIAYFCRNYLK